MHQRPVEHPGEDLGVGVRMVRIARPGADPVVVVHQQRPEPDVAGVVVDAEGEAVPGIGALGHGAEPAPGPPHLDRVGHHPPSISGACGAATYPGRHAAAPRSRADRPGSGVGLGLSATPGDPAQRRADRHRARRSGDLRDQDQLAGAGDLASADLLPAPRRVPARRPGAGRGTLVLRVEGAGVLPRRGRRGQGPRRGGLVLPAARGRCTRRCAGTSPSMPGRWTAAWSTESWWCRSPAASTAAGSPQP